MQHSYLIRTSSLFGFEQLVLSLGGDPTALLARYQLELSALTSERQTVEVNLVANLLNTCAETLNCPLFGLRLGAMQNFNMLGALGVLIENCDTARKAIQLLQSYMAYHNQSEYWDYLEYPNLVVIQRFDNFTQQNNTQQIRELAMSACFHLCRAFFGRHFDPLRLEFSHNNTTDIKRYCALLGIDVMFNTERDALVLAGNALDLPIHKEDRTIKARQLDYLDTLRGDYLQPIDERVSSLLQQSMGSQLANIDNIAQILNLSRRTLQRQLALRGLTFRQLLHNVRINKAKWYLASSQIDITLLSSLLGYTDVSNFSRAFRASEGCSPMQWRKRSWGKSS